MRALLDTNIVIHRENTRATNHSIGQLFYWLDKLHYDKVVHPYTVEELRKYQDFGMQELYDAKLSAYIQMENVAEQTEQFKKILNSTTNTNNDVIDNQLLFEVYCGRVDILITEDRKMHLKAEKVGIRNQVYSIDSFIVKCTEENPKMINYHALSVRKTTFGEVNIQDPFLIHLGYHMNILTVGLKENVIKRHTYVKRTIMKYKVFYT